MEKQIKEKIGIVGCGNMGRAILTGLLAKKIVRPKQICVCDRDRPRALRLKKMFHVAVSSNNQGLVKCSNIVLLAFKPQDLAAVGGELKSCFKAGQVVISILAGTPIAKLKKHLGGKPVYVRVMPNLPAQIGEGISAVASSNKRAAQKAQLILSGCGKVVGLSEKYFDVVTAVSGSGPAYFFLIMELLAQYARGNGISPAIANLLAVQTAHGAGCLASMAKDTPEMLRASVTSKKGTTEAALKFLQRKRFPQILTAALDQARRRSSELGRR